LVTISLPQATTLGQVQKCDVMPRMRFRPHRTALIDENRVCGARVGWRSTPTIRENEVENDNGERRSYANDSRDGRRVAYAFLAPFSGF
jgi:hypothetical protein